jgi:hypothetical protein
VTRPDPAATVTSGSAASSGRPPRGVRCQGAQVDLVAEAAAECGDGAGGVVAAADEAAVHQCLDPAACRLERRRHGQGRGGDDQAGVVAQQLPKPQHDHGVASSQQHREQPIGRGAAEDTVQVIEPVAQDRGADRRWQDGEADPDAPVPLMGLTSLLRGVAYLVRIFGAYILRTGGDLCKGWRRLLIDGRSKWCRELTGAGLRQSFTPE